MEHLLRHGGTKPNTPRLLVIHAMGEYIRDGGTVYHATEFLDKYGLSAHELWAPNGDVYHCRRHDQRAWHARGFNRDSIGAECLVAGEHDYGSFIKAISVPYLTPEQYATAVERGRFIMENNPISWIARHSDLSPGRKVDPGDGFPWWQYLDDLGVVDDEAERQEI